MAGWDAEIHLKTLFVLAAAAAVGIGTDLLFRKVHRNSSTGLAGEPLRPLDLTRVAKKSVAFWFILLLFYGVHWVTPQSREYFAPFWAAFVTVLPWLLVVTPLYAGYVDRRQIEPDDAYIETFNLLRGLRPADAVAFRSFALGWAVKAFFLPLMFVYLSERIHLFTSALGTDPFASFWYFQEYYINIIFFLDVLIASMGYILTLRVFDSHIRSTETSAFGWIVCLLCYQPFWALTETYLAYEQDGLRWSDFVGHLPVAYYAWGVLILALMTMVVVSTTMFGIRFSNLTHRGIITSGPYRWTKHPGYLAKNLSWWLVSVPFLSATGDWLLSLQCCLLLAGVNLIYFARAVTEERHLARDPTYREYQDFIAEHGLFANLRKLVSRVVEAGARRVPH